MLQIMRHKFNSQVTTFIKAVLKFIIYVMGKTFE